MKILSVCFFVLYMFSQSIHSEIQSHSLTRASSSSSYPLSRQRGAMKDGLSSSDDSLKYSLDSIATSSR